MYKIFIVEDEQISFYHQFSIQVGQINDVIYDRLRVECREINRDSLFAAFGRLS